MTTGSTHELLTRDEQPKSILVTGGTGFVGRQVVRHLLDRGFRVSLIARSPGAARKADSRIQSVRETSDLFSESLERLMRLVEGCDTVIHCAWCTDRIDYISTLANTDCLEGSVRLARACAATGAARFVGVGTCAEYDHTAGTLATSAPLRPTSLYAASKAAAFLVLSSLLPQLGVKFTWCRLFYLFGEGEREDRLIPTVRRHLKQGNPVPLTNGSQIRDFLNVAEAGRLIAEAAMDGVDGPLNICSEIGQSVRSLVETVADEYGRRDLLRFGERPLSSFDPPCIVGKRRE
jgi:dTDP-6-deoxy-L-talose 4-dehydrogenase (NAD+)